MVGRRYGKALFQAARDKDQLADVYSQLRELRKIFIEIPDLGNILTDARLEPNEKDDIFNALIPSFEGLVEDFLKVVYSYLRMDSLVQIIDEYERRYDEYRGIMYGTVKSVIPLSEEQLAQLQLKLQPIFGAKKIKLENVIDPSVLGGLEIEARNHVIDGTLKTRLDEMKQELYK